MDRSVILAPALVLSFFAACGGPPPVCDGSQPHSTSRLVLEGAPAEFTLHVVAHAPLLELSRPVIDGVEDDGLVLFPADDSESLRAVVRCSSESSVPVWVEGDRTLVTSCDPDGVRFGALVDRLDIALSESAAGDRLQSASSDSFERRWRDLRMEYAPVRPSGDECPNGAFDGELVVSY